MKEHHPRPGSPAEAIVILERALADLYARLLDLEDRLETLEGRRNGRRYEPPDVVFIPADEVWPRA